MFLSIFRPQVGDPLETFGSLGARVSKLGEALVFAIPKATIVCGHVPPRRLDGAVAVHAFLDRLVGVRTSTRTRRGQSLGTGSRHGGLRWSWSTFGRRGKPRSRCRRSRSHFLAGIFLHPIEKDTSILCRPCLALTCALVVIGVIVFVRIGPSHTLQKSFIVHFDKPRG